MTTGFWKALVGVAILVFCIGFALFRGPRLWKSFNMGQKAFQYWSQIALIVGFSVIALGLTSGDILVSIVGIVTLTAGLSLVFQVNFRGVNQNNEEKSPIEQSQHVLPLSINVVLEEVRSARDQQFAQIDGLDAKAGVIIGASGVILALLVSGLLETLSPLVYPFLFKVATIPIILALILSLISISVRRWHNPLNLTRLRQHYINKPEEETKLAIIDTSISGIENNLGHINVRVFILQMSFLFLGLGLGLFSVWISLVIWR